MLSDELISNKKPKYVHDYNDNHEMNIIYYKEQEIGRLQNQLKYCKDFDEKNDIYSELNLAKKEYNRYLSNPNKCNLLYNLVEKYMKLNKKDQLIEKQFYEIKFIESFKNKFKIIFVVDTSLSMMFGTCGYNPLSLAIGLLALYSFDDSFISFSYNPKVMSIKESENKIDLWSYFKFTIDNYEISKSNIKKTIDKIASLKKEYDIVIFLSDMSYDTMIENVENINISNYIKKKFNQAPPKFAFWNLNETFTNSDIATNNDGFLIINGVSEDINFQEIINKLYNLSI
jgi:hypothetical protein